MSTLDTQQCGNVMFPNNLNIKIYYINLTALILKIVGLCGTAYTQTKTVTHKLNVSSII